jgi:hypothetical protein
MANIKLTSSIAVYQYCSIRTDNEKSVFALATSSAWLNPRSARLRMLAASSLCLNAPSVA